jgi:hypothetical protein
MMLGACFTKPTRPTTVVEATQPTPPLPAECSPTAGYGHLTGRVLRENRPVPYYGLSFVPAASLPVMGPPDEFRAENGRFKLRVRAGSGDLVVAGPRFVRRILFDHSVDACTVKDLGDIHVRTGRTLYGRTLDANGAPLSSANVRLVHGAGTTSSMGTLHDLANRVFSTESSTDGAFAITGLGEDAGGLHVSATLGALSSGELLVHSSTKTIDIELLPTGSITGTVTSFNKSMVGSGVVAWSNTNRSMSMLSAIDDAGNFALQSVPEGPYTVSLLDQPSAFQRVVVVAGASASLTF